jgi:hypothetical protein
MRVSQAAYLRSLRPKMYLTPPCLVAALDFLLNDKVALQDIQVWGLAIA